MGEEEEVEDVGMKSICLSSSQCHCPQEEDDEDGRMMLMMMMMECIATGNQKEPTLTDGWTERRDDPVEKGNQKEPTLTDCWMERRDDPVTVLAT